MPPNAMGSGSDPGVMRLYCAVMLGGAIGSALRLWLATSVSNRAGDSFPWGTLVVNVTGSFLIGLFISLTAPEAKWALPPLARQFVTAGVLGGFTTFSAFSAQTVTLLNNGDLPRAVGNVVFSIGLCLVACWMGMFAGSTFGRHPG